MFGRIAHDVRRFFVSSHKEASTTMVIDIPPPKKPLRLSTGAAGLPAVAAVGCRAGRRSPGAVDQRLRQWLGSVRPARHLSGGRVLRPRPGSPAQGGLVRDRPGPPVPQPMGSRPPRERCLAVARPGHPTQPDGLVQLSGPVVGAGLRPARRGGSAGHPRGARHRRGGRTRWHIRSVRRLATSAGQPGQARQAAGGAGGRRGRRCRRPTEPIATVLDGRDGRRSAGPAATLPAGRRGPGRPLGPEPGTTQGQAAARRQGQGQRHRPGGPPGPRQGEGLRPDVHGGIRGGYRVAADPVVRRLPPGDRCRDAAADARPDRSEPSRARLGSARSNSTGSPRSRPTAARRGIGWDTKARSGGVGATTTRWSSTATAARRSIAAVARCAIVASAIPTRGGPSSAWRGRNRSRPTRDG